MWRTYLWRENRCKLLPLTISMRKHFPEYLIDSISFLVDNNKVIWDKLQMNANTESSKIFLSIFTFCRQRSGSTIALLDLLLFRMITLLLTTLGSYFRGKFAQKEESVVAIRKLLEQFWNFRQFWKPRNLNFRRFLREIVQICVKGGNAGKTFFRARKKLLNGVLKSGFKPFSLSTSAKKIHNPLFNMTMTWRSPINC